MCMMAADCLERLGVSRGDYAIRVNNRKVLDGLLDAIGLAGEAHAGRRLTVLRAMDKLDRLGLDGVRALLGRGRMDESGDYAKGAEIEPDGIDRVLAFLAPDGNPLERMKEAVGGSEAGREGVAELREIEALCAAAGYQDRVRIDPSVVRGLEYYTGPVFEAELTFTVANEDGQPIRFGSVGGGGRYDGLVARFRGDPVPATGFSIGVSRLQAALGVLGRLGTGAELGPVVVLVMDRDRIAEYQALVARLRGAGIRAELYLGASGMKAQMKYADRRGSPCVVIQGSNEREQGVVQVKDLIEGARAASEISDREVWRETRPAQFTVPVDGLVEAVAEVLARHRTP
jgi:histidyl-tRNA synthetase